ncbi:hypothetical protein FZI85_29945 [Mycobacterium sp. CBMA293]|nr:hypothetical protein [Mycolicibacterium sp. CBMA 360]MUL62740.1 hypothetical protein [Mycolicibacterium sp. CBMA 335]MUL69616.1 hypothetical protein [Mycolicibacterium sp. CBMA 311]MUL97402.1 hypothetical protein [Mycolicibacterium sp. CBMA 230]MUM15216.1 hypothetical protein [Mycolicibacterium sp. CBMA 293]MUM30406.1 hypothetical protein [Mycolicibacterium sp. CBMA 361]
MRIRSQSTRGRIVGALADAGGHDHTHHTHQHGPHRDHHVHTHHDLGCRSRLNQKADQLQKRPQKAARRTQTGRAITRRNQRPQTHHGVHRGTRDPAVLRQNLRWTPQQPANILRRFFLVGRDHHDHTHAAQPT